MPLQRFIPSSSDRYISNDKNQGAVKFGHLNAVVDYINENGGGAPAGAIGEVQFNGGGVLAADPGLFWDNTNKYLGIGTSTPFAPLTVGSNSSFYSVQSAGTGSDFFYTDINPDLTAGANNQVVSLMRLRDRGRNNTGGFTGTQRLSLIMENAGGSEFPFQLFSETGSMRIGYSTIATPSAQVEIRGAGSTFATTSLLVQNSSGADLFKVRDDAQIICAGSINLAGISATAYGLFGNQSYDPAVVLGAQSTTAGFLPPRMTTTQKTAISAPASGLQVFDTTTAEQNIYDGSGWRNVIAGDNTNLVWDNTNKRLGVGTSTPTKALDVIGAGRFYQSFGVGIPSLFSYNGRTEVDSTMRLENLGGGKLYFGGNGLLTEGSVSFGQLTAPTARLQVKGSGSTSATTSLLVQDSAGTELFRVRDDGQTITRGTFQFNQANAIIDGEGWYSASTNKTVNMYGDGAVSSGVRVTGSSYSGGASQIQIKGATSISSGFNQPDASAQLDIQSTTKGFLPPRMTTAEKIAIATPAAGLVVYDNTLNQMSYYNGSTWVNV